MSDQGEPYKLYACGFNAWNQLSVSETEEPYDILEFRCIEKAPGIRVAYAGISCTTVEWHTAGEQGLRSVTAGIDDDYVTFFMIDPDFPQQTATAGNGKIAMTARPGTYSMVKFFNSWRDFVPSGGFTFDGPITQLCANETCFMALVMDKVWTWGDERFDACLGREVTDESPAHIPCRVPDLDDDDLKIIKIASGGYTTAALTADNDIYIWGCTNPVPTSAARTVDLTGLELTIHPTPLDIDNHDFKDLAIGDNHIILLTTTNRILVYGSGENGQLGLGVGEDGWGKSVGQWTEVDPKLEPGWSILSVTAGPKSSFFATAGPKNSLCARAGQ